MKRNFNVMLIALEQAKNYLDIRYFETMESACSFGRQLKDYNKNFTILGAFNVNKKSNHCWKVSLYDKKTKIKHQVFVKSKKECIIVAKMFCEYENKYSTNFKKCY